MLIFRGMNLRLYISVAPAVSESPAGSCVINHH